MTSPLTIQRAAEAVTDYPAADPSYRFYDQLMRVSSGAIDLAGATPEPDLAAIYSVLQFGAIIPPWSPWRGVSRFMPGYRYRGTTPIGPLQIDVSSRLDVVDLRSQEIAVSRVLDSWIVSTLGDSPDPVVLFSGGVDSGLIAARLASLGRRDALLLNFSFGEDDAESALAEAMAAHLGLRFERVLGTRDLCDCLIDPGRVYPQPFGDHSTVQTSDLAVSVIRRLEGEGRMIFDGTGADGAFGMGGKIRLWNRIMRIPRLVRSAGARMYAAGFWRRRGTLERQLRILRRSSSMPLTSAVLAQNPLAGILYDDSLAGEANKKLSEWVGAWAGYSPAHEIVAADLALTCAGTFCQKAHSMYGKAGLSVQYPFLASEFVSFALASVENGPVGEPKAALKAALAQQVPREWVYRSKSGFIDPRGRVFHDPKFIAYLRGTIEKGGPIEPLLRRSLISRACDLLARGGDLPPQTLNCIWACVFLDRWYRSAG